MSINIKKTHRLASGAQPEMMLHLYQQMSDSEFVDEKKSHRLTSEAKSEVMMHLYQQMSGSEFVDEKKSHQLTRTSINIFIQIF